MRIFSPVRGGDRRAPPAGAGWGGERGVRGASVAQGYWHDAASSAATFVDGWLRTGDLGFLRDGELYVTGRLKDLVIIDGRNHYPQDLELAAEMSHPALRPGCTAAFSVPADAGVEGEQIVLVAEVAP